MVSILLDGSCGDSGIRRQGPGCGIHCRQTYGSVADGPGVLQPLRRTKKTLGKAPQLAKNHQKTAHFFHLPVFAKLAARASWHNDASLFGTISQIDLSASRPIKNRPLARAETAQQAC
jgi:hypothetical protein